jgi:alkyl hydroperoxide reductase subunit AhpC
LRTGHRSCWPLALLLLTALGATASAEEPKAPKAPQEPALKVGQIAPSFLLKTINPDKAGMTVFSTKKVMGSRAKDRKSAVVLSFGAWYCGPCKKELPELKKLAERCRDKNVLVVEVLMDKEPEHLESMRKLTVDELALPFPVLHDRFGIVARRYGAIELPHVVVIDGDGVVRWIHSGFSPDGIKRLNQTVDAVLAAAAPAPQKPPKKHK